MSSPLTPTFDELPAEIPIFPLSDVVLLPKGVLPLNIFEPRYIAMIDYALKHDRNLILKAHKYNNIKMNITIVIALVSVVLHGVL